MTKRLAGTARVMHARVLRVGQEGVHVHAPSQESIAVPLMVHHAPTACLACIASLVRGVSLIVLQFAPLASIL